jgi:neutral amino acid transport system permease protein
MDWSFIWNVSLSSIVELEAVVFCLAAIGINVQFGYTGLLNFGQSAFLAVAAYGMASMIVLAGTPFWVGIVVGLVAAAVLAVLLGIPTLRLRADYLAIVTIAAAEIVRLLVRSVTFRDYFGGSDGLQDFSADFFALNPLTADAQYGFGPWTYNGRDTWVLIVGWIIVVLFSLLVFLLMRSPWGRVLKAIREDEDAVRSLGKNVYWFKMQSLLLGALIGAFAGFIYALGRSAIQPDQFSTNLTFFAYAMLILGGAARVFGPIIGAMIFWFVFQFSDTLLTEAVGAGYITFIDSTQALQVKVIVVGVALMLLMIFRPQGILGDRKEIALDER